MMRTVTAIAAAGATGALARYGLEGVISRRFAGVFPMGTFVVNVSGAFVAGLLFTVLTERFVVAPWIRSTLMIGFLGAYTTFSTFSLETLRLIEDRAYGVGLLNSVGSLIAGLIAVYAGVVVGRAM